MENKNELRLLLFAVGLAAQVFRPGDAYVGDNTVNTTAIERARTFAEAVIAESKRLGVQMHG